MTRPMFCLNPRLRAIADRVTPGSRVADIGTDHALLPIWLCHEGIVRYAIAADAAADPLKRAKKNIEYYRCADKIDTRMSDGLRDIAPDEVDEVLIAGMGGELIARILDDASWNRPEIRWILQPMSASEDLRAYLAAHGYEIENEQAVRSMNRIYSVMTVRYTGALTPCDETSEARWIGALLPNTSEESRQYIKRQLRHMKNIAAGHRIRGENTKADAYAQLIERLERAVREEKGEKP